MSSSLFVFPDLQDLVSGVKTTTVATSMAEYFAKKLAGVTGQVGH